ncbi:MAG: hypothetical protein IKS43_07220 [Clostridia bacterium]|nr:hypothetical protein [Clostridia bacterium]
MLDLKRTAAVLFAALVLLPLVSCGGRGSAPIDEEEAYSCGHGVAAYIEGLYVYSCGTSDRKLMYLDLASVNEPDPLCFKPECTHSDETCSASIKSPSVYSCNGRLYFLALDDGYEIGLFEMAPDGTGRREFCRIPMLEGKDRKNYTAFIQSGYAAFEITDIVDGAATYSYWLMDINKPKEAPLLLSDDGDSTYLLQSIRLGTLYAVRCSKDAGGESLVGFSVTTGEMRTVVEKWSRENAMHVQDGRLYWYAPEEGFFSKDINTGETVKYRSADRATEYGMALYDDRYVYFSNAFPALDALGWVPKGERGIRVFDHEGRLKLFIPSDTEQTPYGIFPRMAAPEAIVFQEVSQQDGKPKWYLKKSDIETGSAELIPIPGSGRPAGGGASN